MNQIKFRKYNKKEKTLSIGGAIYYSKDEDKTYYQDNCENLYDETDYIISQYTGLRDKKNKEIYEGDIIKLINPDFFRNEENRNYLLNNKIQVRYSLDSSGNYPWAGFTLIRMNPVDLEDGIILDCMSCQAIKIIGNIWENPELL